MRYYVLLVLITCAAFTAASALAALTASAAWPLIRRRTRGLPSSTRARTIAAARLLPAAAGLLCAGILAATFMRYEPRDTSEAPGLLLVLTASVTLALVGAALRKGLAARRATAECSRLLQTCARATTRADGTRIWIVQTDYPVAAVMGIFRPRLLLSARLLEECTEPELDAVVRHEQAHVSRRDNLVRAAMLYLPDPLAYLGPGSEMQDAWAAAAEESADDAAAGAEAEARTVLAAALVRVGKMASTPAPRWMPSMAFYEGTNLEHRVRRLLDSGRLRHHMTMPLVPALLAAACGVALILTDPVARRLHDWMELAVQFVP